MLSKIAKWWTPDDVVFVEAIPPRATGKMQKNRLRETFKDYKLPSNAAAAWRVVLPIAQPL